MSKRDLVDPVREFNPDILSYTWRKLNPITTIPFCLSFLILLSLHDFTKSASKENCFNLDHSVISTTLPINEFQYSSGLWKHTSALLTERD